MIVADASILARLLIPEAETPLAIRAYRRDRVWYAPRLVLSEIQNVLSQQVRLRGLSLPDAQHLLRRLESFVVAVDNRSHAREVLARAAELELSAYDAEYVVLAESMGAALVTFDRKLAAAAPHVALSPTEFLESETVHEPVSSAKSRGSWRPPRSIAR